MFVLLRDYLRKLEGKTKDEKKEEIVSEKESSIKDDMEDNLVDESDKQEKEKEQEQEQVRKKTRIEIIKERKREEKLKKKEKKRRKKKPITVYSVLLLLIFIVVFVSRICLLTSSETYILNGQIIYSSKLNKYVINYDIEELWNDNKLALNEKVCIPQDYTKDRAAIKDYPGECVPGVIVEASNKVKIKYDLPKYMTYDELKLFVINGSFGQTINRVKIEIKKWGDLYQITKIYPMN